MRHLVLGGDIRIGQGRAGEPWQDLLPLLRSADFRVTSLECAVPPVDVLLAGGFDACSLATYHSLDLGIPGLLAARCRLERAGIRAAGAGRDLIEASAPVIIDGVALVAGTQQEGAFAAAPSRPGLSSYPLDLDAEALCGIGDRVRRARDAGAKLVIFSYHWGPGKGESPSSLLRRFAQAVIDRGADVFHGHGSHSFSAVEIYRGKPILYDTGKLLDDSHSRFLNDGSFVYGARFEDSRLQGLELHPIELFHDPATHEARARLARPEAREGIMERMRRLSSGMGTGFSRQRDRLLVRVPTRDLPEDFGSLALEGSGLRAA